MCTSSSSGRNNIIDHNEEYMDKAGCTNTGIISNEMSDNVCRDLCGFKNPNLLDHSGKIFEPYIGVDTYDNDKSEIGNTDNCYQHVQSGDSNSTTHFVQIKSEPNICVKSSNHVTCSESEVIGSPNSIQNGEVSVKMEPITCDAFDPSCCILTDKLTHKLGNKSLNVHEQLDRLSSNSMNYAICIKYEPDSGAEGESHTSDSIASPSRSEDQANNYHIRDNSHCYSNCGNISDNVLNRGHQQSCGPIKIEINDSHMRKDSIASTSPQHNSVNTFYHDTCCASDEQLHSSHKNVNIHMGKQKLKLLSPKQDYTKKEFKCNVCSYTTICMSYLKRHKMQHAVEKPYKCDVCSYSTTRSSNLKEHQANHTGEKPYKCNVCSYSTSRSDHLVEHKLRHTGVKQYKCDVCSYSSVRFRDLVKHKRKHTGENPHKCDVCSYSSSRFCDLVRHKRKHTGQKPYKCDVCSYCASESSDLVKHKRKHTGEKPYKCDVCNFSTAWPRSLKAHKQQHMDK